MKPENPYYPLLISSTACDNYTPPHHAGICLRAPVSFLHINQIAEMRSIEWLLIFTETVYRSDLPLYQWCEAPGEQDDGG